MPSGRARLLHHVYTWLRIVGESTYVIHEYTKSTLLLRIESHLTKACPIPDATEEDSNANVVALRPADDLLRADTHDEESEND